MTALSESQKSYLGQLNQGGAQAIPVSTYATLSDLGLVKASATSTAPGKARKFAEITPAGRKALAA
jgi:DNA-binding PadR family transcriptional regulator